jgi:hypothetical protein
MKWSDELRRESEIGNRTSWDLEHFAQSGDSTIEELMDEKRMNMDHFLDKSWSKPRYVVHWTKSNLEVLPLPPNSFVSPSRFGFRALLFIPIILQLSLISSTIFSKRKMNGRG